MTRRTLWLLRLFRLVVAAAFLLSAAFPGGPRAQAQDGANPTFTADISKNQISGQNWPYMQSVSISVDDPNTPISPDYSNMIAPWIDPGNPLATWFSIDTYWYDLKSGDVVTLTSGMEPDTITKTLTLSSLSLGAIDQANDRVSANFGFGASSAEILVATDAGGWVSRRAPAGFTGGPWMADFSTPSGAGPSDAAYDITSGTRGYIKQYDANMNATQMEWHMPRPFLQVWPNHRSLNAIDFPLGENLTLTIQHAAAEGLPNEVVSMLSQPTPAGHGNYASWTVMFGNIHPLDTVTVTSDSGLSVTHTVDQLSILTADVDRNLVAGTAVPGKTINVQSVGMNCNRFVTANAEGKWAAYLSQPGESGELPCSLTQYDNGNANTSDSTGTGTYVAFFISQVFVYTSLSNNEITVSNFPADLPVTFSIDDPATGPGEDYSDAIQPNGGLINFIPNGYTLRGGELVTFTNGFTTHNFTIAPIAVTSVDLTRDVLTGTAAPGQQLMAGPICDAYGCGFRVVNADDNGQWTADFSVPGVNPGETMIKDIGFGDWVGARVTDGMNTTDAAAFPNNIALNAWPVENIVFIENFSSALPVTVTVDDPATPENPDYTSPESYPESYQWDPNYTQVMFDLDPYDLKPGDVIRATNGQLTREHTVRYMEAPSVDVDADTISGRASPGDKIEVGNLCGNGNCAFRYGYADAQGDWTVYFAFPQAGALWNQQFTFDIQPGWQETARIREADGDTTTVWWRTHKPFFSVNLDRPEINAFDWPVNEPIRVEVFEGGAGEPVYTGSFIPQVADWNPNETYLNLRIELYTPKAGDLVRLTGGGFTKELIVAPLAVSNYDMYTDTISGTAAAGMVLEAHPHCNYNCGFRRITAGEDGSFIFDFTVPGDEWGEENPFDFGMGSGVSVFTRDADDDITAYDSWQPYVAFGARLSSNQVHVVDGQGDGIP